MKGALSIRANPRKGWSILYSYFLIWRHWVPSFSVLSEISVVDRNYYVYLCGWGSRAQKFGGEAEAEIVKGMKKIPYPGPLAQGNQN